MQNEGLTGEEARGSVETVAGGRMRPRVADILIPHLLQDVFDKLKREKFQLKTNKQRARLWRASFVF